MRSDFQLAKFDYKFFKIENKYRGCFISKITTVIIKLNKIFTFYFIQTKVMKGQF